MVGDEYLVAPVLTEGAVNVTVYLPGGLWVHWWTGETYHSVKGYTVTVAAPLGTPAAFHRNSTEALRFTHELSRRLPAYGN